MLLDGLLVVLLHLLVQVLILATRVTHGVTVQLVQSTGNALLLDWDLHTAAYHNLVAISKQTTIE